MTRAEELSVKESGEKKEKYFYEYDKDGAV